MYLIFLIPFLTQLSFYYSIPKLYHLALGHEFFQSALKKYPGCKIMGSLHLVFWFTSRKLLNFLRSYPINYHKKIKSIQCSRCETYFFKNLFFLLLPFPTQIFFLGIQDGPPNCFWRAVFPFYGKIFKHVTLFRYGSQKELAFPVFSNFYHKSAILK